ncbi:MAG: hypothetical protein FWF20_02840 [Betaproteobacteria bacterium]|nr:hypothetical protein [Betaproteobacteria bacterium]
MTAERLRLMFPAIFHRSRRISLGWLLGLLLLLPLTQSLALGHELSHFGEWDERTQPRGSVPHGEACALCLAAASIDGGGLPAAAQAFVLLDAKAARLPLAAIAAPMALALRAYRSRAPPVAA